VRSVRLWVGLLALVCFLGGISTGLFLADMGWAGTDRADAGANERRRTGEPFEEYRLAFVQRFQLDAQRERLFAELLRNYSKEIEDARTGLLRRSQPELETTLSDIGQRYRSFIRDHVLPPDQRGEFDALSEEWQEI